MTFSSYSNYVIFESYEQIFFSCPCFTAV